MNNFTKVGSDYECVPMFVPPFVLENMARADIEEAKTTILQSKLIRTERVKPATVKQALLIRTAAPEAPAVGKADRYIYDSQQTQNLQVKLVCKEGNLSAECDEEAKNAYNFMGDFRDYLKNKLNRNSLDDNGMDLIGNVHYGINFDNAFWDGKEMVFGDGDGKIFTNFTKSLDVVAHEMGHGVVQYYANFDYNGQPGALNEHFADVFGSVVTQYIEKQTAEEADWLIGDEIMGPELYGEALRCMSEPGTAFDNDLLGKDPQPDHYKDLYTGTKDNGGVHTNSGIMNKAFYLTAVKIGTDQAFLIWFNALKSLWATANFNDAFAQIVKSARLLVKDEKVRKESAQIIRTAFKEVGLPSK